MGRRDSNDKQWKAVKEFVTKRDKGRDRLLSCLTMKEAMILQRLAPRILLQKLDHAHILPVGAHVELTYELRNIVLLNRWSHDHLDNMKHPITGTPIDKEEHKKWWLRIASHQKQFIEEHWTF